MNKKKLGLIALAIALIMISAVVFVACNSYKWDSIGGGNPDAATVSNGGYFVRQGGYAYFINGYGGAVTKNDWGNALKQGIVRAELNTDGTVNNDTVKLLVPLVIENKNAKGGIAVFGDWVYYPSPNTEKDKSGTPSTTKTDFMRTRIDGKYTQRIGTIDSRESEYMFTPTRVYYYLSNTISYFDFSGMKTNKSLDDAKGVSGGTLASGVDSVIWNYAPSYQRGQTEKVSDYFFYTERLSGDNSFESYNNTYAVKFDGSNKTLIITKDTYLSESEKSDLTANPGNEDKYQNKIPTVMLLGSYLESDDTVTLYYTKKHKLGTESFDTARLYMAKFNASAKSVDIATEIELTTLTTEKVFPLGYENGCLAAIGDDYKLYHKDLSDASEAPAIIEASKTLHYAYQGKLYYSESSATELDCIEFDKTGVTSNASCVIAENFKSDWLKLEFDGSYFYFINTKYNYLHYIDILTFDNADEDAKSMFIGKMTQADADKKAADDKAEEEAKKDN